MPQHAPKPYDAVIVGSGPNGLSAAITLARAGLRVLVLERHGRVGGGLSSVVRGGFMHDIGSAIHPLGYASPAWKDWPLHAFGLSWVHPPAPYAHVFTAGPRKGEAFAMPHNLQEAALKLRADGPAWKALFGPLVRHNAALLQDTLRPLLRLPKHPLLLARFGLPALAPADALAQAAFKSETTRAVWAGLCAHVNVPLPTLGVGAGALMLGAAAHAGGWPLPRGGAQALADALAAYLRFLGGEVRLNAPVTSRADVPPCHALLVDSSPAVLRGLLRRSTPAYDFWLQRFRYGAGILKLDYALDGPVPWLDAEARQSATLHLGGTLAHIQRGEAQVAGGGLPEQPFMLAAQHTLFDPSRAPAGGHTLWLYAHAPADVTPAYAERLEHLLEAVAPGFRALVRHRIVTTSRHIEDFSPVFVGGDVNGGRFDLGGLLARPTPSPTPYRTPERGVYLCSASTPPGGGVQGMNGVHAARAALSDVFRS